MTFKTRIRFQRIELLTRPLIWNKVADLLAGIHTFR